MSATQREYEAPETGCVRDHGCTCPSHGTAGDCTLAVPTNRTRMITRECIFFGIDKKKKNIIKAWARTTYCETKEFKGGLGDLNDQRKECGQKEITTVSRVHRRWPNRDTGSNSDSNSDFESDNEVVDGVERMKI